MQLDLFATVLGSYATHRDSRLANEQLYEDVAHRLGIAEDELERKVEIGISGQRHSIWKRRIRFAQQTLKHMGLLERVAGERGIWTLTEAAGKQLKRAQGGVSLVAFSTELGLCIWGSNKDALAGLEDQITCCITSPPYPLAKPRAYGNPSLADYVDFITSSLEPVAARLAPGGTIVLNLGNDVFLRGMPVRSNYCEELVIALGKRLGLYKLGMIPWIDLSKPPGPVQWASKTRFQLNSAWEPIYVFTNDPLRCKANNQRVLEPHSEKHANLIAAGGERRVTSYGDGAYRLRESSFSRPTEGRIPRNVLLRGHRCADTVAHHRHAKELGLPAHGAMMPTQIADFFVRYLSEPGDLIVDLWGGTSKTGLAAQRAGRRWVTMEIILEYARVAAENFRKFDGFLLSPALACVGNSNS